MTFEQEVVGDVCRNHEMGQRQVEEGRMRWRWGGERHADGGTGSGVAAARASTIPRLGLHLAEGWRHDSADGQQVCAA